MKRGLLVLLSLAVLWGMTACGAEESRRRSSRRTTARTGVYERIIPDDAIKLQLEKTVAVRDTCEFTVVSAELTDRVEPPAVDDSDYYYTSYTADSGKTYVDVCIAYKNLNEEAVDLGSALQAELVYGNRYVYSAYLALETENGHDFTYAAYEDVVPLATENLHCLFLVPQAVSQGSGSLVMLLTLGKDVFSLTIRDGEVGKAPDLNPNAREKSGGVISTGELVLLPDTCVFSVDACQMDYEIEAPEADSYSTVYRADDGKVYVDLCLIYQNLSQRTAQMSQVMEGELLYGGRYRYEPTIVMETQERSDFSYAYSAEVAALAEEYVHLLFEVPEEVMNSSQSVKVSLTIDGKQFTYQIR